MERRSFTDYVKRKLDSKLWEAMEQYFQNVSTNSFSFALQKVKNPAEVEMIDTEVKMVGVHNLPSTMIGFDVIYDVQCKVFDEDRFHNHLGEYKDQWYLMECVGDLLDGLKNLEVKHIEPYYSKNKHLKPMSDSLVPIIHSDELEKYATEFISKYYPEAIEKPMYIDPFEIVKRMGLNLINTSINEEGSIFGQIYFNDQETEIYDKETKQYKKINVTAGTILVDEDVVFQRNIGSYNNTVIHECVHWEYHKKVFLLEKLYNDEATLIKCKVDGDIDGNYNEAMGWVEYQANALAPRIQMPFPAFKLKASEVLRKYEKEYNTVNICDMMPFVIQELADFYHVSKMSAKIRLIDAGYNEAMGSLIYIDNRYVRPHKFKKDFLEPNQTFSISELDAMFLSVADPSLYDVTKDGSYQFIDSHFVLNDPKYIDEDGEMTEYARFHMDECCLVFELKIKNKISTYYSKLCFLNRDKDSYVEFEPKYHGNWEKKEKSEYVDDLLKQDQKLYSEMPNNIGGALKKCIDWAGVTQKGLSEATGVSEDTISRIINNKVRPERNTLLLLILSLKTPPTSSELLFEISACPLKITNEEDARIRHLLIYKNGLPFDKACEYLRKYNIKI